MDDARTVALDWVLRQARDELRRSSVGWAASRQAMSIAEKLAANLFGPGVKLTANEAVLFGLFVGAVAKSLDAHGSGGREIATTNDAAPSPWPAAARAVYSSLHSVWGAFRFRR